MGRDVAFEGFVGDTERDKGDGTSRRLSFHVHLGIFLPGVIAVAELSGGGSCKQMVSGANVGHDGVHWI